VTSSPHDAPSAPLHHHQIAPTTHTVELAQLVEINERLAAGEGRPAITWADLPPDPASTSPAAGSPAPEAVLVRLSADGSPEFPYIQGHFALPGVGGTGSQPGPTAQVVGLHTAALQAVSHRLGLRHRWGV